MSEMTRYAMYEYIKKGRSGESTKNSVGLSIYGIRTYRFDEKKIQTLCYLIVLIITIKLAVS